MSYPCRDNRLHPENKIFHNKGSETRDCSNPISTVLALPVRTRLKIRNRERKVRPHRTVACTSFSPPLFGAQHSPTPSLGCLTSSQRSGATPSKFVITSHALPSLEVSLWTVHISLTPADITSGRGILRPLGAGVQANARCTRRKRSGPGRLSLLRLFKPPSCWLSKRKYTLSRASIFLPLSSIISGSITSGIMVERKLQLPSG